MGVSSTHLYVGVNDIEDEMNIDDFSSPFLSLSIFCLMVSIAIFLNLEVCVKTTHDIKTHERCALEQLREIII